MFIKFAENKQDMVKIKVFVLCSFVFALAFIVACSPDAKKCAEYTTPEAKNMCLINLAIEKKDIGICRQVLEQGQKDFCIYAVSGLLRDTSSCHEIVNISIKDKCLGIHYQQKTVDTCNLISSSKLRADCTIDIAVRGRNYGLCDSMDKQFKDGCYMGIAAFHGDIEKCSLILNPEIRDFCVSFSVRSEKDLKLCDGFNDILKEQCTANIAGASGKIELCSRLGSAKFRDYCIRDAARALKDGSHCKSISNSTIEDECYRGLAIYTKNSDFCGSIVNANVRKMCFDSVNK